MLIVFVFYFNFLISAKRTHYRIKCTLLCRQKNICIHISFFRIIIIIIIELFYLIYTFLMIRMLDFIICFSKPFSPFVFLKLLFLLIITSIMHLFFYDQYLSTYFILLIYNTRLVYLRINYTYFITPLILLSFFFYFYKSSSAYERSIWQKS